MKNDTRNFRRYTERRELQDLDKHSHFKIFRNIELYAYRGKREEEKGGYKVRKSLRGHETNWKSREYKKVRRILEKVAPQKFYCKRNREDSKNEEKC